MFYFSEMELNNFNEFIVETRDPVRNHDFCCGCIQIPLSLLTTIIGVLGLLKIIISLIYRDVLGRKNLFFSTLNIFCSSILHKLHALFKFIIILYFRRVIRFHSSWDMGISFYHFCIIVVLQI